MTVTPATEYVDRARELGPELEAAAEHIEGRRELPEPIVEALVERGFFRLLLPRSLGGAELPPAAYVQVIEEVAKHDASTAWCLGQANGCAMTAALLDPEVAQEIFGGRRGIVAWGPPGPAEARAVAGGYRLTGTWSFASGSHHATWLGAHVAILGEDGTPRLRPDGGSVMRTLLFPKASAKFSDIWHVIGLRGTGSDSYTVTDLFVPESHTVLREAEPKPRQPGLLYAFSSSNMYSSGFAGVALGIARSTLDAFIELARDKIPRGAKRTLRDDNVVQSQVAQSEARLRAARAFLLGSLEQIWRDVARSGRLTLDHNTTIRLASTWAIHQAKDVVDAAYHAAGATAIFENNPFERRFRDVHTVIQQYQGRQAHFATVGQVLLGLQAEGTMFTFLTGMAERITHHRSFARQRWSLDDIPWQAIRHDKVANSDAFFYLVASASLMESATDLYTENLIEFLAGDDEITSWLEDYWLPEELQHGRALRRYVETAWPEFEWEPAYLRFVEEFRPFCDTSLETRRSLEMASRCVVEMGTASYYTTLSRASPEPVLSLLARRIVEDEVRHYKHFYRFFRQYREAECPSRAAIIPALWRRLRMTGGNDSFIVLKNVYHARYPEAAFDAAVNRDLRRRCRDLVRDHFPHEMSVRMLLKPLALGPRTQRAALPVAVAVARRLVP